MAGVPMTISFGVTLSVGKELRERATSGDSVVIAADVIGR